MVPMPMVYRLTVILVGIELASQPPNHWRTLKNSLQMMTKFIEFEIYNQSAIDLNGNILLKAPVIIAKY